jgi:hypothetical protein
VSVAGFVAAWVLAARNRDLADISADFGPDRFLVAYAVAGAVVASRRASNPIGWFLLGIGLVTASRGLAGEYARYALTGPSHPAGAVWAAWFVNWSLTLLFPGGLLTFLLLLFPDGRLLSARWRVVAWLAAGLGMVSAAGLVRSGSRFRGRPARRVQPDRPPGLDPHVAEQPDRERRLDPRLSDTVSSPAASQRSDPPSG